MASIETRQLPQPPQPLDELTEAEFALAVFRNSAEWLKYVDDLHAHAHELQQLVIDIRAQLGNVDEEHDHATDHLPTPPRSEPPAATSADSDGRSQIWVTEYTLSVSSEMPISKISGTVVKPKASSPFVVVGSFSAIMERRVDTKVKKPNGDLENDEARLVRENMGDWKPFARFIEFGDLDIGDQSCFDVISEQSGYKAEMKVEKRRLLWKGSRPRDENNNRAMLIFEKKRSYKRDESFLIPLDIEPEYESPCNLVCQKKQIMARPYYLGQEMNIVLHRKAKSAWDPSFTINPAERIGIHTNGVRQGSL